MAVDDREVGTEHWPEAGEVAEAALITFLWETEKWDALGLDAHHQCQVIFEEWTYLEHIGTPAADCTRVQLRVCF